MFLNQMPHNNLVSPSNIEFSALKKRSGTQMKSAGFSPSNRQSIIRMSNLNTIMRQSIEMSTVVQDANNLNIATVTTPCPGTSELFYTGEKTPNQRRPVSRYMYKPT
jgi:hypothetical protein